MNRVEIIGICTEVTTEYIILNVENSNPLKLFFSEKVDYELIEVGKYTKVLGYLECKDFPFPIVKVDKVYQIKETVN